MHGFLQKGNTKTDGEQLWTPSSPSPTGLDKLKLSKSWREQMDKVSVGRICIVVFGKREILKTMASSFGTVTLAQRGAGSPSSPSPSEFSIETGTGRDFALAPPKMEGRQSDECEP